MSHNNDNIQGNVPDVNSNITVTLSYDKELGRLLNNSNGQTGSGSGYYAASDYYLLFPSHDRRISVFPVVLTTSPKVGTHIIKYVPFSSVIVSPLTVAFPA